MRARARARRRPPTRNARARPPPPAPARPQHAPARTRTQHARMTHAPAYRPGTHAKHADIRKMLVSTHLDTRMLRPLGHAGVCSKLPSPPGARERPVAGLLWPVLCAPEGLGGGAKRGPGRRGPSPHVHTVHTENRTSTPSLLYPYSTMVLTYVSDLYKWNLVWTIRTGGQALDSSGAFLSTMPGRTRSQQSGRYGFYDIVIMSTRRI